MTKIIVLVDEFAEPGAIDILRDQLTDAGVQSMEYHSDILLFNGDYEGELDRLKTLRNVIDVAPEVHLKALAPANP